MAMMRSTARRSTGSEVGGGIILNQATSVMLNKAFQELASQSSSLESSRLVQEYRLNSSAMLSFCSLLKKSIEKARDALRYDLDCVLNAAGLAQLDGARETIQKMRGSRSEGGPSYGGERFCDSFEKMHSCHRQLMEKLETKMDEKEKKLKSARIWTMISFIIFGTFAATLFICAMVAAAVTAPPAVMGVLAVATAFPIVSAGSWIKFLWCRHIRKVEDKYCIFSKMQWHTDNHIKDFSSLCALTLSFEECLESVASNIRFADRLYGDAASLKGTVKEIKKKMKASVKKLDALQAHVTRCETRINSVIFVLVGVENHPHKLEVVVHID